MRGCTTKQIVFCEHYLKTCNATEAIIKAGYKVNENTKAKVAHNNFDSPCIQGYLKDKLIGSSRDMVDEMIDMLICMQEYIERQKDFGKIRNTHKAVFKLHNILLPKEEKTNEKS